MNLMNERLTLTRLTATGRSALATLLLEGPGAAKLLDNFFQGKKSAENSTATGLTPGDALFVGRFGDPGGTEKGQIGTCGGKIGEEIVVRVRSENSLELHCHGGSASIERIQSILAAHGCKLVDWKDQARQCGDPLRAEAKTALAEAATVRTAAVLLDQYQGALRRGIEAILKSLADGDTTAAADQIREILAWADFGRHLVEPWRVVLAGRPNVGKSTLINALAGYKRAIVHQTPGTTRDVLTVATALEGWPVVLADTAGLRAADDAVERFGVRLAEEEIAAADLVLLIFDASAPWTDADEKLRRLGTSTLVVHNKIDLCEETQLTANLRDRPAGVAVSGLCGTGITQLAQAVAARLAPQSPPPLAAVPFTSRQTTALRAALATISEGTAGQASSGTRAREALLSLIQSEPPIPDKSQACDNLQKIPDDPGRRGVVGVAVRDGRFLVIRRAKDVVAPGMYCFPGGGIEDGENESQALAREFGEEIGCEAVPLRRIWQCVTAWKVSLSWWQVRLPVDAVFRPNAAEVESIEWMSLEEMQQLPDLLPSNHDFLAAIAQGEIRLDE